MANEARYGHPPGTPPGTHYRVTVGIVYPVGPLFGGAAAGAAAAGEAAEGAGWVRVGRWMSQAELKAMEETGLAQEGSGGASRVAEPSNPDAYKAAPAGDVYVEYDVPSGSTKPDGTGWSRIPGPNSPEGRLAGRNGEPAPQMPPVKNIEVKGTK